MKYLNNVPPGGYPFFSDDPRFMTEITREALQMLTSPISNNNKVVILDGCTISSSGGVTSVSDGVVLFNNEVMRFDAQTFPNTSGSDKAYWVQESIALENREFQNGDLVAVHMENVCKIEIGTTVPANSLIVAGTKRYWSLVNEKITHPTPPPLPAVFDSVLVNTSGELGAFFLSSDSTGESIALDYILPGFTECNFTNDFVVQKLCTLGDAPLGTVRLMRFNINPTGARTFSIMLNSTFTGVKILKNGVSAPNTVLSPLPINEVIKFIKTSKGWEIFE